jgi:hypothetical protein
VEFERVRSGQQLNVVISITEPFAKTVSDRTRPEHIEPEPIKPFSFRRLRHLSFIPCIRA